MNDHRQTTEDAAGSVPVPRLSSEPPNDDLGGLFPKDGDREPLRDAEGKRKRRKRRTKAEIEAEKAAPAPPPDPEQLEAVASAIGMGFQIASRVVAGQRGAHWALMPEEIDLLGQAWAHALAPYLGAVAGALPWVTALGTTYAIVAPRIAMDADRPALPEGAVPIDPPAKGEG